MYELGFLLHLYQPPNQFHNVLKRVVSECYNPLFDLINSRNDANFTINICWSLTEKLIQHGMDDVLDKIKKAMETGRIEITGSAAYHALLPLIPRDEAKRQVDLNFDSHRKIFGPLYKPRGFFPPEMAIDPQTLDIISEAGYDWTITDDIPFSLINRHVPYNYIATVGELGVLLRSNLWSNKISLDKDKKGKPHRGKEIAEWLKSGLDMWIRGRDGYIILAMDGETFGHHIKGYIEDFLVPFLDALKEYRIRMEHLSTIYDIFPRREEKIPPGSWSTSEEDFWECNFFPLWKNKYNRPQKLLWELTGLAVSGARRIQELLDRSLNSCTFWWIGTHPDELSPITSMGIDMLIEVIRQANPSAIPRAIELKRELEEEFARHRKQLLEKRLEMSRIDSSKYPD
ncbi:MAG: hypothetical protein J7M18_06215 [Candidatus Eremiobacteraeota bacterium]|nr:hypothetical protein [Candidatus Eremiobacteraeota bacterium]